MGWSTRLQDIFKAHRGAAAAGALGFAATVVGAPYAEQSIKLMGEHPPKGYAPDIVAVVTGNNQRIISSMRYVQKSNGEPILLISGAHPSVTYDSLDSELKKLAPEGPYLSDQVVVIETYSKNTHENAVEILQRATLFPPLNMDAAWALDDLSVRERAQARAFFESMGASSGIKRVVVMSSAEHLPRLRLEIENAGIPDNMEITYKSTDSVFAHILDGRLFQEIGRTATVRYGAPQEWFDDKDQVAANELNGP